MILGTKGRYAVMALADMATNKGHISPITLSDISSRQSISLDYLEQIFARLRKNMIVHSMKGPGGGYILSRHPETILIYEIIIAVQESMKMVRCIDNELTGERNGCMNDGSRCLTHNLWEGMEQAIGNYLQNVSLADVIMGTKS